MEEGRSAGSAALGGDWTAQTDAACASDREKELLATGALADHLATAQRLASECGDGRIDLRFGHKQVGVRAV